MADKFILTWSCADQPGIVADVANMLAGAGCNITSSDQYADDDSGQFFMRVAFSPINVSLSCAELKERFKPLAEKFQMEWDIHDASEPQKVLIMVSKFDHCLMDLLYRKERGAINMDVRAVVSNHRDSYKLAASYDVQFQHWPVTKDNKLKQEEKLIKLIEEEEIDLIILARYMQVLSNKACEKLAGKVINIHHSFLPSFKGAVPYQQAFHKGVKLIGATAHYVTPDLDEGPIIEQNVARVNHAMSVTDLVTTGRDVERVTLAEAVKLHLEHRVLLNGNKTVVFKR
ncbi:formyltetrahydrofolate deformylase [Kordiimonas sp. SCSIO 12603]|uniref:formyltetrahydrofolate deformylase n=1 Tax=Kordiimonas sp. SCSIO 12603 TaxID=2829596 RepID=UPI002101F375|nr:formyltetrahydrofolate deformylase [Kordiimonas sp. SCSIO 12603]UTW57779.1 formyltetrahydrofolate deformylase [Kordiimonas sp. SCSIO 12603]